MNKEQCTFYQSMKSWEARLNNTDRSDADHVQYLQEKYNAAKAIVTQREYLGMYN